MKLADLTIGQRIAVVVGAAWLVVIAGAAAEGYGSFEWDGFFFAGGLPVTLLWGIVWIVAAKKKDKSDSD